MSSHLRSEAAIQDSVEQSVKQFGGIDIVVNNASAISLTGTQETPMKTYDLMHQVCPTQSSGRIYIVQASKPLT